MDTSLIEPLAVAQNTTPRTFARARSRTTTTRSPVASPAGTPTKLLSAAMIDLELGSPTRRGKRMRQDITDSKKEEVENQQQEEVVSVKTPKKKRKVTVADRQSSSSDLVSKFFQRSASFARGLRGTSKGTSKKVFVSSTAAPGAATEGNSMEVTDELVSSLSTDSISASSSILASTEVVSSVSSAVTSNASRSKRLHRGNELSELKPSYSCATLPRGVHLNRLSIFSKHTSPFFAPMIQDEAGWIVETGSPRVTTLDLSTTSSAVSPRAAASSSLTSLSVSELARVNETDAWYAAYFQQNEHSNWLGVETTHGPVSISVMRDGDLVRAIVRTEKTQEKIALPVSMLLKNSGNLLKKDKRGLLKSIIPPGWHLKNVREVKETKHIEELAMFEKNEVQTKFKWAVLYARHGQKNEDEMFANNETSEHFKEFLEVLGDTIQLKGWDRYNGGLDVTKNATGEKSIFSDFNEFEIMFHVAPYLPHDPDCQQQLERKRHLGNDVVVIVFVDNENQSGSLINDPPAYLPTTIRTHFQHVLAVVQRDPTCAPGDRTRYRVHIARKNDVPSFGPQLPSPAVFDKTQLRNVLLTKLVNGERAALKAPSFERAIARTRSGFVQYYHQEYPKK